MADALQRGFAYLMLIFGVSALASWATAFRNRVYLAPIGLAFLALGAALTLPPGMHALRVALLVVAGVIFLAGLGLAVTEVRRELRAIEEKRRGLEQEMYEYMKRLEAGRAKQDEPKDGGQGEVSSKK